MILDGDLVRRRRVELRRSVRQVAADLGVSGAVITALEGGSNHKDLSVGFLNRLAGALGLQLTTLIRSDAREPVDDDAAEGDVEADAATVGAVLHASEILTPIDTIAEVLNWPRRRVDVALDALEAALPAAGMRLHRLHRCASIRRSVEAVDPSIVSRAVRAHLGNEGLSLTEARVLTAIRDGRLPEVLRNPDEVALGVLVNAGLVDMPEAPTRSTQGSWKFTDDVRYSLLLDSDRS